MTHSSRRLSPERRTRILGAARRLVLHQGLRPTTMEAIAREARVAKPTLYAYFRDREAVFRGVTEAAAAEMGASFDRAMRMDGDVATRIGRGLAAKAKAAARFRDGSPHADALFGAGEGPPAEPFAALEQRIEAAITAVLAASGIGRARPLTRLLLAAADGIGRRASDPAEIGPAIRLVTERLLRPEFEAAAGSGRGEPGRPPAR